MEFCNQCGLPNTSFQEGVCHECWKDNQNRLDEHNARYDWWQSLTDKERDKQIRKEQL